MSPGNIDGKGEKRPEYRITRDGFTLLAMGFTGKAALAWKIKYIEAFNQLEERATARAVKLAERRVLASSRKSLPPPEPALEAQALARLRAGMFVLYFGADGDMCLFSRSRKCVVAEPEELADMIADPKSKIGREVLPGIIKAAAQRLS